MTTNPKVDDYLRDGCGRCAFGGTPQCKVHSWESELARLRAIVLSCGLTEELKWGVPCYTFNKSNVLIVAAFREYCSISFFKGSLLQDADKLLDPPGENSQAARLFRFTELKQIEKLEKKIREYIFEAIEIEKAGLKVDFKKTDELEYPEELLEKFDQLPALKKAFEDLTPGRKRGYILFFTQPKQSATRTSRIEKYVQHILLGKGMQDK